MINKWLYLSAVIISMVTSVKVDPKGYVVYCPCMGRFGNQADHFLGSLAFAKALDRTLVLPPWVEYRFPDPKSKQVPFKTYFQVEPLSAYHRVITMDKFMKKLAPSIWPAGKRTAYCYAARTHGPKQNDCNAKDGNPFGPFWDTFNIDFDKSEFYSPLFHDTSNLHDMQRWKDRYDPAYHPVLAFSGAPAEFPVAQKHVGLHKYLKWSDTMVKKRDQVIEKEIGTEKYLGIHLRLGSDFDNACKHLRDSPLMFSAAQCLGYNMQHGRASKEMCYQSDSTIIRDVTAVLEDTGLTAVYIATDSRDLMHKLSSKFPQVKFVKHDPSNPHVDLAVLGKADHFIGNCISSFTAFVKRERDANGRPSKFWDFPPTSHDEL